MKPLLLPLVSLLISTTLMAGEATSPIPTNDPLHANAALQYWMAISSLPEAKNTEWLDAALKPDTEAPAQAEQNNSIYLRYFTLGATMPTCSFGTVVSSAIMGPSTTMPQVAHMRRLTRLMCARSAWRFQHHQPAAAVDDVLTVMTAGVHCASHSSLIEALVAFTQLHMAMETLARYLPDCPMDQRHRLTEALGDRRYDLLQAPGLLVGEYSMLASMDQFSANMVAAAKKAETTDETNEIIALFSNDAQRTAMIQAMRTFHDGVRRTITLPESQWSNEMVRLNTVLKNELAPSPKALKFATMTTSAYDSILTYMRRYSLQYAMLRHAAAQADQTNGLEQLSDFAVEGIQVQVARQGGVTTLTAANTEFTKKPLVLKIGHGPLLVPQTSANGDPTLENNAAQPVGAKSF